MDREAVVGLIGTFFSFSLGQWNHIVGIIAGLFTITYMSVMIYQRLKNK